MKTLFEKIQAVAKDVMSVDKDMQVGNGNYGYKAVSDLSVTKKVKESEQKHGIISIPTKQELVHQEVLRTQNNKGETLKYSFLIKMTVRIVEVANPENFIEIESFGHGLDSGDKGFGKASTYARKYALLNAYKIATGEDPDAEKSKEDNAPETQDAKMVAVKNYLMDNAETAQKMMHHFNVGNLDDITKDQYATIYKSYKKKGLVK